MKYCENCGIENNDSDKMCKKCYGLLFSNEKLKISEKPDIIVSIICFILPLIGLIIASFCDNKKARSRYRNCALFGMLFFLVVSLINKCYIEYEYNKEVNKIIEEIFSREK